MNALVHFVPEFERGGVLVALKEINLVIQVLILQAVHVLFLFQEGINHAAAAVRLPENGGVPAGNAAGGQVDRTQKSVLDAEKPVHDFRHHVLGPGAMKTAHAKVIEEEFLDEAPGVFAAQFARGHEIASVVHVIFPHDRHG